MIVLNYFPVLGRYLSMDFSFCVLRATGPALSEETREALIETARQIFQDAGGQSLSRSKTCTFKTSNAEGEITTRLTPLGLGTFWGVVFSAEIETDLGTNKIRYIVGLEMLEHRGGVRYEWLPVEEPESHPRNNAMFN